MQPVEADNSLNEIIAEADALIAQAQASLDKSAELYKELGVDKAVLLSAAERLMSPKEKADLDRLIAEDEAAIERDIAERKALAANNAYSLKGEKMRRRTMV